MVAVGFCAIVSLLCSPLVALAFPASKKSKSIIRIEKTPKGFGKRQLNFEDLLETFPNRKPESVEDQPCPCGLDGKNYGDCCFPFHSKSLYPQSPRSVLKSRYSAFVYRLIGYIIDTTHPSSRDYRDDKIAWAQDLNKNGMFDSFQFVGLEILQNNDLSKKENIFEEDYIEFQVTIQAKIQRQQSKNPTMLQTIDGQNTTIREKSKFLKDSETGIWSYASGEIRSNVIGIENVVLNKS
jgi:SEC-C motif domain protein